MQLDAAVEDTVSPPREARSSDLTQSTVPLPYMITVIGTVVVIAFFVFSIKSDVQLINLRLEYEAKMRVSDKESVEQQFKALEAKIEAAGLRNAAMAFSTQLSDEKTKGRK
jgi:hypothetical protein